MAWTPKTQHLKSSELLDKKRFYRLLSAQTNFIDPKTTMLFYTGLVFLIANELEKHKFVRLPDIGDLALVEQAPRPAWCGRMHAMISRRFVLKFYPKQRFRQYFNSKQDIRWTELMPPKFIK
jgi:nucleoid DNA-binding protein